MSWMEQINPATAVWRGVQAYAAERIAELTAVCTTARSTDVEIRAAQAAIQELGALLALPARITLQAQQRGTTDRSKGY
jgi:hypothetical protein